MGCAWKDLLLHLLEVLLLWCMHAGRCSCCSSADMFKSLSSRACLQKVTAQARSFQTTTVPTGCSMSMDRSVLLVTPLAI